MKHFYIFLLTLSFIGLISLTQAQNLDVDVVDTDGVTHNIQSYLDQGKPVFVFAFSNYWQSWYHYENNNLVELYNTYGQGGNNDVVVLMFASFGFETEADLDGIDYSSGLGAGYENVSFTENNPIPIALYEDNPEMPVVYEGAGLEMYCHTNQSSFSGEGLLPDNVDNYMEGVYTLCCTALETFDPALYPITSYNTPDCEPQIVEFTFSNESAFDIDSCLIDVIANGMWLDQFDVAELVPGCTSTTLTYQNEAFAPGDSVTFAIAQSNDQTHNDTISVIIEPVDTVRGHLRGEIIYPQEIPYTAYISPGPGNFPIDAESNYSYDLFYEEGCRLIETQFLIEGWDMTDAHFRLTSRNADGTVEKILIDSIGDDFSWNYMQSLNLFVEETVSQQAWGYVYEDVNDDQTFHPDVPRIPGVQVDHDVYTTFTDANGYYEFPEITLNEPISIEYDEITWPVYTTPNAGNLNWGNYIHNFGLLSDDPVWDLSANFDSGIPYMCEWGISQGIHVSNSGNQPVSGTIEFVFDDELTLTGTSPDPIDITGNTITWNVPELGYNQFANFAAHFDTVSSDQLGNIFTATYNLTGYDVDDNVIANSTETLSDTLQCAYDPNDIYGFPLGSGPQGLIAANTPLKYRIRFQNTGNAPATNVTVVDTLPETLDWNTFIPGPSSHEYQVQMNAETREVKWIFNGINLPDSASDPLGSIGHIFYDIEMADLNIGDQILNQAHIFFDQNQPISTNVSMHTIADIDTGVDEMEWSFEIYPNPANSSVLVESNEMTGHYIEIIDLNGKVLTQQFTQSTTTWIDLSFLEQGVYLISVADPDSGTRKVKRLVKL